MNNPNIKFEKHCDISTVGVCGAGIATAFFANLARQTDVETAAELMGTIYGTWHPKKHHSLFYLIKVDGVVVGFAYLLKASSPRKYWCIEALYIVEHLNNRGYGSRLLQHIISEHKKISLCALPSSVHFYQSNGFHRVKTCLDGTILMNSTGAKTDAIRPILFNALASSQYLELGGQIPYIQGYFSMKLGGQCKNDNNN